MKKISLFLLAVLALLACASPPVTAATITQPCGNGAANTGGPPGSGQDGAGDPYTVYPGNEYRHIPDLKVWGGIGESQLVWGRWANSRFVSGQTDFGTGHGWRHTYQWEMATAAPSGTAARMEIVYPDGQDNLFTQNATTPTTWNPVVSIEDTLFQSGTDFYLQRKNGFRYHFTKNVDGLGNVYYLMTDFTDSKLNDYTLTYNSAHQVTQVTEPGGRYLQVNYTTVSLNKVDFNDLARINTVPANNAWTQITVTDPTAYRYLRYLSPDEGFCNVAEVQFYDNHGNLLTGTPFGTYPPYTSSTGYAKAFDGNTSTYVQDTHASGGYCGIDLGAGTSAVISKVRFYPRSGYTTSMVGPWTWNSSNYGKFQGSNQAASSISVVSSVTTNDGRTVGYTYSAFNDPLVPYVYQTLTKVTYDDGKQASYGYAQALPSTQPLVVSFNDPRYELPFTKSKTTYCTQLGNAVGEIQSQSNYDTNQIVNTLGCISTHTPTVSTVTGALNQYQQDPSSGLNMSITDALGNVSSSTYDSNGFKNYQQDARGNATTASKSTFDNPLTQTWPDTTQRSWTRDSLDLPLTSTDELGNTATCTRDTNHRITNITYPDTSSESFTYNSFGEPLTHTMRNGYSESATYDTTGLKTTSTDPYGQVTNYTYDALSRLASVTDALSQTTSYQYDARSHVTLATYPDSSTHSYTYDTYGNKLTDTDELGHTTTCTYDTFNRCTSITDALSRKTQFVFRTNYYLTKPDQIILPSGKITAFTYDLMDNVLTQTVGYGTADAATTSYVYDANYNVTSMTDPNGHVWSFVYDTRNRKTSQTDPLSHTTSYTYDAANNILTVTRPDGGVTTNVYDKMHHLTQTTDPKGQITTMTYDLSGNLLTTTDARSNTYTNTYDKLNRRTSMTYPDSSVESYTYDVIGRPGTYTTRSGAIKTSTYDNRNRETSYTWSDGVTSGVTRTFDATGKLLTSANGVSTSTYVYDNANEMTKETQANVAAGVSWPVSYTYSVDGNRSGLTYPSGVAVTYGFTNRNQVNSIAKGGTNVATYTYDTNGNTLTKIMANGTVAGYTYDNVNRLTTLNNSLSGTSFARFDYGYDNVNRRTFEQRDSAAGDTYGYDAVDQVTSVNYEATNPSSGSSGATRTVGYSLDATGNRTGVADSVNGSTSYSANNLNQYTTINGVTYGYDGNGNLIGGSGTYLYDAQNRLNTAQIGTNTDQYYYDSKNRVVQREVNGTPTYFVYDGWDLIEERDATNTVLATYVHGVREDEILTKTTPANTVYYHSNAQGNVTDLTNTSGTVVEKYKYDAFGKPAFFDGSGTPLTATAYGNRFLFTGREYLAEVNLYDYRNRVYSANLGRFMQTDPLSFAAGDVNIYRYCGNNPVNMADSMGTRANASTVAIHMVAITEFKMGNALSMETTVGSKCVSKGAGPDDPLASPPSPDDDYDEALDLDFDDTDANTYFSSQSRTGFFGNQFSFILGEGFTFGFGEYTSIDSDGNFTTGHYFTYGMGTGLDVAAGTTTGTTATDANGFAGPYDNTSFSVEFAGVTGMGTNGSVRGESANLSVGVNFGVSTTKTTTVLFW